MNVGRLRVAVEKDRESGRGVWAMVNAKNGCVREYEVDSGRVCRRVGISERGKSWFCCYHTHH